jgi:hypothetical protein
MSIEEIATMENAARPTKGAGAATLVYFVQAAKLGLIKIGVATDARRRLIALQTGSPDRLSLLGVVGADDAAAFERDLHARFRRHWTHGEWFEPAAPRLDYIARFARDPDEVVGEQIMARARRALERRDRPARQAAADEALQRFIDSRT